MAALSDKVALQRLATRIAQRRVQLGMNKIDVVRASGLTTTTYAKLEGGLSVRDVTYAKLEPALDWAIGSCREILEGGEPTPLDASSVDGIVVSTVTHGPLGDEIGQALQDAAFALEDISLTTEDVRKLKQRALEELRRRGVID
jgi:transcriptional regulator with XRE-family HTH domain